MSCSPVKSYNAKKLCASLLVTIISLSLRVNCDLDLNETKSENSSSSLVPCSDEEQCLDNMRDRMLLMQNFDGFVRDTSANLNSRHIDRLKHSSVIYGLIEAVEENQLNQQCYKEIAQIYHGINRKEIWAMKSESGLLEIKALAAAEPRKASNWFLSVAKSRSFIRTKSPKKSVEIATLTALESNGSQPRVSQIAVEGRHR